MLSAGREASGNQQRHYHVTLPRIRAGYFTALSTTENTTKVLWQVQVHTALMRLDADPSLESQQALHRHLQSLEAGAPLSTLHVACAYAELSQNCHAVHPELSLRIVSELSRTQCSCQSHGGLHL